MSAPIITVEQLRHAVDGFRLAHDGRFPTLHDDGALPGLGWGTIDNRFRDGHRGLPGCTSLSKWLDETYPEERFAGAITSANLHAWVATHRGADSGAFPHIGSGAILGANRTWQSVHEALRDRDFPFTKCKSLSGWLDDQFPLDRRKRAILITADLIVGAVDAYRAEHRGEFPYRESGKLAGLNLTWTQIDNALRQGGKSLAKWLSKRYPDFVEVSERRLLAWTEDFANQNARALPTMKSGEIAGTGWSWLQVDRAFRSGAWRWTTVDTLSAWLDTAYPAERILTPENVQNWVASHIASQGTFPSSDSTAPVAESSAWTWQRINATMVRGAFGWREKCSLAAWLDSQYPDARMLTPRNLHAWVRNHVDAHGHFPSRQSLEPASPGAHWNWFEVDKALRRESAGWRGRTTLSKWIEANVVPSAQLDTHCVDEDVERMEAPAPGA